MWSLEDAAGVTLTRCAALAVIPGVAHAFSTRRATGGGDFDLGPAEGESAAVRRRRERFLAAAGLGSARPAVLRQVHQAGLVDARTIGGAVPEADGVLYDRVADRGSPVPAVRTADCVPILMATRDGGLMAAVHGGWRGIAGGIASAAVARLQAAGCEASALTVALGPAILGCCYEVGPEVAARLELTCGPVAGFAGRSGKGRATVDLHAAASAQLVAAGVPPSSIHAAPFCTKCRTDLFFSFRAEGTECGRLMAVIGPTAGP